MLNNEKKGMISIIIPTLIWGSVGINVRLLNQQGLEPFFINFINMLIGSIFIFILAKFKGKEICLKNDKDTTSHLILQGLFFGCTVILIFFAFLYTSIANATFLQKTMPLWVMVLSVFILKEKLTLRKITALIIALIGKFLLFQLNLKTSSLKGDFLALLSALTFSGMVLNGRKLKDVSEFTSTFFQLSVACLLMFPFMLLRLKSNYLENVWIAIFLLLFLGVVNTAITQRLFLYGLRFVEASKASVLTFIEPMSATLFAFFFFSEKLAFNSILGLFLMTISVVIILASTKN